MAYITSDEAMLDSQRGRLVGLCYGNLDVAEDLAQETLYEALRNAYKVHDASGYDRWLFSIARNVCLRWISSRGRDAQRYSLLNRDRDAADDYDLDAEFDRHALADVLDRALALLPPESRDVLIERYVYNSPQQEIAAKLGLTAPAVAKRLERGRLRLKRLLSTDLIHESVLYGLADKLYDDWEETSLWCNEFAVNWSLLATPEGQRFWQQHSRMRWLPDREIEVGGMRAIVTGCESMTGSSTIGGNLYA